MKRKSSLIVLICAVCGLVLAGCSNSSDNSTVADAGIHQRDAVHEQVTHASRCLRGLGAGTIGWGWFARNSVSALVAEVERTLFACEETG